MGNKEGQFQLKLYITMIFCVVIAILMTSTILYFNFQSILMKHEYKAKLENMESEAARITKLSNISLNTVFQIFIDISIKKLMTYENIDVIDETKAMIQLRSYLSTVPNVDSIYVYNKNNNRIYSVTNEEDLVRPWRADYDQNNNEFFDQSAVDMINNRIDYLPYIPIPRYYPVNEKYTKCVYTYIMYNTFNSSNPSGVVMLNIEAQNLFQENSLDPNSISLVIDQDDNIIYSSSEEFQVREKLSNRFDPEEQIKTNETGYYLTEIDGIRSVVIFTGPDKHHWRYISIIEYNVLLAQVNKMQAICILITLLIAGVGGLVAHIFSKRLSRPIQTLFLNAKNLQSENRQLEKLATNRKLTELLENGGLDSTGNPITGQYFLSLIGIEFTEESNLVVMCLHIDGYKSLLDTLSVIEIQSYKFAAFNIISELMGHKFKTHYIDMGNEKGLLLINGNTTVTKEYLEAEITQMQHYMSDNFSVSMSVIVSKPENDPNNLYAMYEKIEESLSRSIFYGEGYLEFISDLSANIDYQYEYSDQKEKQLIESLMLGKANEAKKIYEDIITQTYQYPIIIYNMVISRLIFAIDNVVSVIKKNSIEGAFTGYFVLTNLMQETDSLELRNAKFYDLFDRIQRELENRKSERQEQVIGRITNMLDNSLEDPSFSLDTLSETIGMSAAYMCRIYKQYTGRTIMDILVSKRMEKAKELLVNTDLPINEIAIKVGYRNSTYFYRVFKKENGVTPNEFRKR